MRITVQVSVDTPDHTEPVVCEVFTLERDALAVDFGRPASGRGPRAGHGPAGGVGPRADFRSLGPAPLLNNESAGKHKSGRTRKGNAEIRTILTECAWTAGRTGTYVGAQFRRMHHRFGKTGGGKAAIAVAHTLIVIIWHVLHDGTAYRDLGSDYFTRYDNPEARKRRLIRDRHTLGYEVTVRPAA